MPITAKSNPIRLLFAATPHSKARLSDRAVSRQHARIRYAEDHRRIQDLKSADGASLNGAKVSVAPLNPGERIRADSSEFEFRG